MIIWLIFAALTVAVMLAVLGPFYRTDSASRSRDAFDREIYRDQLAEVDGDLERGVLGPEEADAARIEISRRLIAAEEADAQVSGATSADQSGDPFRKITFWAMALLIPATGLGGYLVLGNADLPSQPHASRFENPDQQKNFAVLIARVEERLRTHPEDGRGWKVLAPVYMRQGRYNDAADAFEKAIATLGEDEELLTGFAEALISANRGIIAPDARAAYVKVLKKNKNSLVARFRLAMADEQDGNLKKASSEYRELLLLGDPEGSWRKIVSDRLAAVNQQMLGSQEGEGSQSASRSAPGPGPSADDVKAAQKMSAAERSQMINSMVERLSKRLQDDGDDIDGWLRLMNAYMVLGKAEAAKSALVSARKQFSGNTQALSRLDQLARRLDL